MDSRVLLSVGLKNGTFCHYHYNYNSSSLTSFEQLIYDFLLVINTNLPPVLHRFRDVAVDRSEIATFGYPSCV